MGNNWLSEEEVRRVLGLKEEAKKEEVAKEEKIPVMAGAAENNSGKESKNDNEYRKAVEVYPVELQQFDEEFDEIEQMKTEFELLSDIPMEVRVVLARVKKTIEEISNMKTGDIISTDRLAGEPVDIMVGDQIIAKGEIVAMEDKFAVYITEIVSPEERIKSAERKLGKKN